MVLEGTPNLFAYLVLAASGLVALIVFSVLRPPLATTLVLMGGLMFLPGGISFDASGIPPLDKNVLPVLYALAGCLIHARPQLISSRSRGVIDACSVLLLLGTVITPLLNRDVLVYGPTILPAMGPYDCLSSSLQTALAYVVPFYLGRALIRSRRDLRDLLGMIVVGGLVYSLLILIELRFSPQLHRWLYGYHQVNFQMALRMGGYRPTVFMRSGLEVAMFMLVAALAANALGRAGAMLLTIPMRWIAAGLFVILISCKSLGAIVYGTLLAPAAALLPPRILARGSAVIAILIFATPILRTFDWVPTEAVVEFFETVDEARATSLGGRFDNEDALLDKAWQRTWFGWGGYGRNRIYDPSTGADLSVTDGYWVIQIGTAGIVGFAAIFGLLLVPVGRAARWTANLASRADQQAVAGLALIVVVLTLDLIPNGFLSTFTMYLAGALSGSTTGIEAGRSEGRRRVRSPYAREMPAPLGAPPPPSGRSAARDLVGPRRS